uniref:Uncharacterized protein n=1 Tax=Arundo donax TaxID=35708 RepID=A0A0A9DDF0_ARUDO
MKFKNVLCQAMKLLIISIKQCHRALLILSSSDDPGFSLVALKYRST